MIKVYTQQELDVELNKSKQVLAIFYSSWCPYCIRFLPVFEEKVAGLGFEKIVNVLLEDNDNPLWDTYDVGAVPTVILFENSKVSKRLDGRLGSGLKEQQFVTWLQELKQ